MTEEELKKYRQDYALVSGLYFYIKTKEAELKKFKFNRVQKYLWSLLLDDLRKGIPVRWMIIKSRQLGCSTWIVLLFYWIISFYPNRNGLIVAHEEPAAIELGEKAKLVYRTIPPELRPMVKTNNRHELHFGNPNEEGPLGLESKIAVKTADSPILGASYTLQMVLLSEFALWEERKLNAKERLGTVLQTVPKQFGTFVFIETTARGEGYCKEMWDDADNSYRKIFISWVAEEKYRLFIKPEEYFKLVDDDSHKYGDETEVAKLIEIELDKWYPELKHLNSQIRTQTIQHEIMCRLAWRRSMINDECQGDKQIFQRDYPLTAEEAFVGSGKSVFSQSKLKEIKNYLLTYIPQVRRYRFDSVLQRFYESTYGPLKIYCLPKKGEKYVIGVDPAQGIEGGDPSGLVLLSVPSLIQCASFEDIIDPDELALLIYHLHLLYNKAYTGVEVNDKGGYLVVNSLKKLGLRNQYKREVLDSSNLKKVVEKFGWFSGPMTKPTMVSDMRQIIKLHNTTILDITVISQLLKYKLLSNGHMKAIDGKDHLADSYMIALQMSKYVHKGNYDDFTGVRKWSLNWWCNLSDQYNGVSENIGYVPRGSYL